MSILLDAAYAIAAIFASPWIAYRLIARGDARSVAARFGLRIGGRLRRAIWLHGSSAGEIALLVPLVRMLEHAEIRNPLIISAYSATGYIAARKSFPNCRVVYFPFDLSFVVRRYFRRFDPCVIVIVESEFWPNFLLAADKREIPVAVINGKISAKSSRFHRVTQLVPMLLRRLALVAVQTADNAARLAGLGLPAERIHVTGNMKYDLAPDTAAREDSETMRERLGYSADAIVILGGSVHEREDEALIRAFEALTGEYPQARLVLAPRYPQDAARTMQCAAAHDFAALRKTAVDRGPVRPIKSADVLVVDTVGELRFLYALADVAYVGGSLYFRGSNKGGHNLMEPAVLGVPVLFGPHHWSFRDTAQALVDADAGREVRDVEDLVNALRRLLADESLRRASGRRAREVILERQGATRQNFELLLPLIDAANRRLPASGLSATMPPAVSDVDLRS